MWRAPLGVPRRHSCRRPRFFSKWGGLPARSRLPGGSFLAPCTAARTSLSPYPPTTSHFQPPSPGSPPLYKYDRKPHPPDSGKIDLAEVFYSVQEQMLAQLAVGGFFEHPTALGSATEHQWLDLFNRAISPNATAPPPPSSSTPEGRFAPAVRHDHPFSTTSTRLSSSLTNPASTSPPKASTPSSKSSPLSPASGSATLVKKPPPSAPSAAPPSASSPAIHSANPSAPAPSSPDSLPPAPSGPPKRSKKISAPPCARHPTTSTSAAPSNTAPSNIPAEKSPSASRKSL